MSFVDAVFSLAVLVKGMSDDATDNVGMCKSLGNRVALIPRLLEQYPHIAELDDKFLMGLFEALKESRELIVQYGKKGKVSRFFLSSGIKKKFDDLDARISQCIDDLTLSVGINSSSKIETLNEKMESTITTMCSLMAAGSAGSDVTSIDQIEQQQIQDEFLLDYNDIEFSIKRGVRKEVGTSTDARLYLAKMNDKDVVVREPIFSVNPEICQKWKARVAAVCTLTKLTNEIPDCFFHIYGGGIEYSDIDEDSNEVENVQQLFVVSKYCSQPSFLEHVASTAWNSNDLGCIMGHIYRITVAIMLLREQPAIIELADFMLTPDAVVVDDSMNLVVSLLGQFDLSSLTSSKGGDFNSSLHFENIALKYLRWYVPEQLKTDLRGRQVDMKHRDVYVIGLLICYMLTSEAPYNESLKGSGDGVDSSKAHSLVEGIRTGNLQPYNLSQVITNPSLLQLLTLCLCSDPKSRPSLQFVLKSLTNLSCELAVSLPFDVRNLAGLSLNYHEENSGDSSDSDADGLTDFDDLTSQVENASQRVKLFRSMSTVTNFRREKSVVVLGSKVILLNFDTNGAGEVTEDCYDDGEEDEVALGNAVNMKDIAPRGGMGERGIVIFHIDNTTSMKQQNRNLLTKDVLLRVIPDMLRKNLRVIVNSWASDPVTKGKIQTREISVSDDMLEPDKKYALSEHIKTFVFEILNPNGKTDLYGSMFQLLDQCEDLSSRLGDDNNIFCFILTDGNHNHFAYPVHTPQCVDEDYFGVYKGVLKNNKLMFGLSGKAGNIQTAQMFLVKKYVSSSSRCNIALTLIGIGDAGTAPLSALADGLGDKCSFIGITEVNQADAAFSSIDNYCGDSGRQLRIAFSTSSSTESEVVQDLHYVLGEEDSPYVSGCAVLDAARSDYVVNRATVAIVSNSKISETFTEIPLQFDDKSVLSEGSKYNRYSYSLEELVEEVLPGLSQIRSNSYDVSAATFQTLFTQLLRDKKNLWQFKTSLYCKKTRNFRTHPLFCAFAVWLKELEYLVDSQISSYRMNVETELFSTLETGGSSSSTVPAAQPSEIVLERLRNNLRNTGKKVHQVHRHVTAIRSIRDRTLNLGLTLLSTELDLKETSSGVVLDVAKKNGKQYTVSWVASTDSDSFKSCLKQQLETVDISLSSSKSSPLSLQLSFPCLLLQSYFDPMTVIRASELFTFCDVYFDAANTRALQFCAEEMWDLCASSNHMVGEELPVTQVLQQLDTRNNSNVTEERQQSTDKEGKVDETAGPKFNMILPVATTPLLMTLYCERGRMFHNGINITGDAMAITSATGQWAKVYHDILFTLPRFTESPLRQRAIIDVALQCIVSYSYAIDFSVLAPCSKMVEVLFTADNSPLTILKRDAMSGLTCPLGLGMLTAYLPKEPIPADLQVNAWNTLLVTIFSRLCEAISGHKNIRYANNRTDPSDLEVPYRLLVGELQTILKRRLHVEWTNSSVDEKLSIVNANAERLRECLRKIVTSFLNRLGEFGLPTLSGVIGLIMTSLKVKNFGIRSLRDMFLKCENDTSDIQSALLTGDKVEEIILPIVHDVTGDDGKLQLSLREVTEADHAFLLAFIDAIVETKVSPKIVYQPVSNPAYPSFSASENQSLQFEKLKLNWNVDLPIANICLIGNVNSGKSSIGGQLLSHLNIVSDKALAKMDHMAKQLGRKENLQFAWVMDNLREERAGGFTVKPKFNGFQTSTRRFTMIDNPGHNDYAVNYACGIYHADIILLVVSAVASEQHLAESIRSMAEEHLVTAFCFGIKQVIVLVNKMDLVGYSEHSFLEAKAKAFKHAKKAGFKVNEESVCIPMSAVEGSGFLNIPSEMTWYDGPCFLQALDECALPLRHEAKALRMVVDDNFKITGVGDVLCGKVERGTLKVGDKINVYPVAENVPVKSIECHGNSIEIARPGDDIGISVSLQNGMFKKIKGSAASGRQRFRRGMLIGHSNDTHVPIMNRFEAQLFIVGKKASLKIGSAPTILTHLLSMQVKVIRIVETLGKNSVVLSRHPDSVKTGDTCIIEFEAREGFPAETIHECPKLSRFVIQCNRMTVAIGFIRANLG